MNQEMMKMMTALKRKGNEPTAKTKPKEKMREEKEQLKENKKAAPLQFSEGRKLKPEN